MLLFEDVMSGVGSTRHITIKYIGEETLVVL